MQHKFIFSSCVRWFLFFFLFWNHVFADFLTFYCWNLKSYYYFRLICLDYMIFYDSFMILQQKKLIHFSILLDPMDE